MMKAFVLNKNKGHFQLMIEIGGLHRNDYDTSILPSNFPIRVIENDYGKVILVGASLRNFTNCKILAYSNLLSKHERIDYDYLQNVYRPKIEAVLADEIFFKEKDDDYSILIITEKKAYQIFNDGYIKEDDLLISHKSLVAYYTGLAESSKNHDEAFLRKVLTASDKIDQTRNFPCAYISTKDYQIKYIEKGEEL